MNLTAFYERSPIWLQNLGVTLYGAKVYRREYGRKFRDLLYEFEQHTRLSSDEVQTLQRRYLQRLLDYAAEHVPYYQALATALRRDGIDFKNPETFARIPVLTREDVRNNVESLIAKSRSRENLIPGRTSGTTGSPLEFYWDEQVCLYKNVVDWRQKRVAGIEPGDRMAFLLGRVVVPISQRRPPYWRRNSLLNHQFFSSFHLSTETLPLYVTELKRFSPLAIEGYPSTLSILASYLIERGQTLPLRAAFSSSETLHPQQREVIERAFECRLFDFYGMAERVVFATECNRHQGKHLNADFGLTEIVGADGQAAQPGDFGRIVATGFHNFGMPLIRYQTSDITKISRTPCPCGNPFPLMEDVTTKAEDIVTTPDGRYISSSILTHPFKPLHNIAESQIIQEDRQSITVKIVRRPAYSNADTEFLLNELQKRLGDAMHIHLEFVDSIDRTSAGKFRWVISKVPLSF